MGANMNVANLNLLVRALHQDVSALDQRLRELEMTVAELRRRRFAEEIDRADIRVRDARSA
jgi:hypothetical protein